MKVPPVGLTPPYRSRAIAVVLALGLVAFPIVDPSPYHLHVGALVAMYVALALGLNVLTGLAGLLDLGYIAFFAVGAYTYALLGLAGVPLGLVFPAGLLLATGFGVLLGLPALRVRGDYLAVVTLGFGEIVRMVATNWTSLTNGPEGLSNLPAPRLGNFEVTSPAGFYLLGLGLLAAVVWTTHRVATSRLGWAWCALRVDEGLATSIGHNLVALKLLAFCLSANVAACCGMFFASFQMFVSPESFVLFESIVILAMVVVGGGIHGNLLGVALGAVALAVMPELFRGFESMRFPAYGVVMMVMVLFRERGLVPWRWLLIAPAMDSRGVAAGTLPDASRPLGLQLTGLSKSFGGVLALDGFTYRFEPGGAYGILGHNGAGKTTLVDTLSGVLKQDRGAIIRLPDVGAQKWRGEIGRTFQRVRLADDLNPFQNVLLGLCSLDWHDAIVEALTSLVPGLTRDSRSETHRAAVALEHVRVAREVWGTPVGELPFGVRRRVELARALARSPGLLLLDEPLSGLSDNEREETLAVLRDLTMKRAWTLVLVEHQHRCMAELCREVLFMTAGRAACDENGSPIGGTLEEVMGHPIVRDTYLGRPSVPPGRPKEPTGNTLLTVSGLTAGYRWRGTVLVNIDLSLCQGEVLLLKGRNGAGKTTLLRAIAGSGALRIDGGAIVYRGDDITRMSTESRARRGVLFCPQERAVFPSLSVSRHFRLTKWDLKPLHHEIDRVLELFPPLREKWREPAGNLSGGQQQMLALAVVLFRASVTGWPTVLLLDEPTSGLQPKLVDGLVESLARVKAEKVGLLVTEQREALDGLADQTLELEAGRLRQSPNRLDADAVAIDSVWPTRPTPDRRTKSAPHG